MKVKHAPTGHRAPKFDFMGWIQEGGRGQITGAVFTELDPFRSFLPEHRRKCSGERCMVRIGQVQLRYREVSFNSVCQSMLIGEVPA